MKKLLTLCILVVSAMVHAAVIPTDNPYTTFYPDYKNLNHWTDNIKWSNVFNIQDYATADTTWDNAYIAARDAVAASGGGVLFFPELPSTKIGADSFYKFNNNLELVSNVVLRGENPNTYATNPDNSFFSRTVLEFPEYVYEDFGSGVPNNTAFKKILLKDNTGENVGVVNMEINRAGIEFNPLWSAKSGFTTFQPATVVKNVIVFGVRSNNVAEPDPGVPAATQSQKYQRWSWRFAANVLVNVSENAVVCNNRFNDLTNNVSRPLGTDNFSQPDYKFEGMGDLQNPPSGEETQFDYLAHYTVIVNRLKKMGTSVPANFLSNSTPEKEPIVFAKGIDVSNNWIFKTQRPGIQANGLGITIRNNVIRDKPESDKVVYVDPTGVRSANINNPPTYECRGIDFGGWGCRVENNDIEVYRMNLQKLKYTEDGEGIAMKGDGGSNSTAKDILIRGNKVVSSSVFDARGRMNGFERILSSEFITIENNDFGNMPLLLDGQTDATDCKAYQTQQNNTIRNNTNIAPGASFNFGIRARASKGGFNNTITGNTGSGSIIASCEHYTVTDNIGFTVAACTPLVVNTNDPNTGSNTCTVLCLPRVTLMGDSIVRSTSVGETREIRFLTNRSQPYTTGQQTITNCPVNARISDVNLYIGDEKFATILPASFTPNNGLSFSGANSDTVVFNFTPSDTGVYKIFLTIQAKQTSDTVTVNSQLLTYAVSLPVEDVKKIVEPQPPVSLEKGINISGEMLLFPNPTAGMVYLQVKTDATETGNVRIFDQLGRVLYATEVFKSGILLKELNVSSLQAGMYFVEYSSGRQKGVKILIKE